MEIILISISLTAAAAAGVHHLRARGRRLTRPVTTLVLAAVTLAISIAGNLDQDVLDALSRDRDLLLSGQWWRLITPLFVQDGGWAGTVFNLVALLIVGTLTETIHGARVLLAAYFAAGILSEIAAYTLLPGQGFAGNSVAVCGLTALCLVAFVRSPPPLSQAVSAIGLLAGGTLVVTGNLHGVGFAVGALAGVVLGALGRHSPPTS